MGLESFGRRRDTCSGRWRCGRGKGGVKTENPGPRATARVAAGRGAATSRTAIVHGDYRIDNTLVAADDPGRVVAVVDWELSTLGDPLADLAQMCVYRHPALDVILV
ncbi:phosphotransferase [Rhodococcus hoagii]|nr:phosphotransferase [Prescottella equi]